MDLYTLINKRRSCRSYTGQPFTKQQLTAINTAIKKFKPLYPDVELKWRYADDMKGPFKVDAPYYLIISGQGKKGERENAGFIFQQFMLWLTSRGIGSVWLGGAKDVDRNLAGNDIVAIAFGEPEGAIHRVESEFKRKPIEKITNSPDDPCMKAVRLAPSGLNLQPWYFEKRGERVLVYRQILKPPINLFYKLTEVDLGIALCHYALACEQLGKPFIFTRQEEEGDKRGFRLFGEIG